MTDFVISGLSTSAQFLSAGQAGMILPSAALGGGNDPVVSFTSSSLTASAMIKLTVLGTLYSDSWATVTGTAFSSLVVIGSAGWIGSTDGAAVWVSAGEEFALSNSGQIEAAGFSALVLNVHDVDLVNAGTIRSADAHGMLVTADRFTLVNSGEIFSIAQEYALQISASTYRIENTGTMGAVSVSGTGSGRIVNLGTIAGRVDLSSGADTFDGALGRLTGDLAGGGGDDLLLTGAGASAIYGGTGHDTIQSGAEADTLRGGSGNDLLVGGTGHDSLSGDEGADTILGDAGFDVIDGGLGRDTVDYRLSGAAVEVDLATGEAFGGDAEGDVLAGIETLRGSAFGDVLSGDGFANLLRGQGGADRLDGGAGNDTLRGDGGADTLIGGSGVDTVTYAGTSQGVIVSLLSGAGLGGHAQGDVLTGVEALIGSEAADRLTGDGGANSLVGGAGGDLLVGGRGNDTLTGGIGAQGDQFYFAFADGTDRITDFERGRDLVDLTDYGLASFAQILALTEVMENGTDTLIDFTPLNIDARIVFQGVLFLNQADMEEAILWQ